VRDAEHRPAFYAARVGGWRDWWTILHPPYTAWHLAYVVIGASMLPTLDTTRLVASLLAFFAAVGVAAHALDERNGHPLSTRLSDAALTGAAIAGLVVAVAFGIAGIVEVGAALIPFVVIGPVLVVAYNLELFGGALHTDLGFAIAWGAFPLLTGYVAQRGTVSVAAFVAAFGAAALSFAQRALSTPARRLRRRVERVDGTLVLTGGTTEPLGVRALLDPLERALKALSWAVVALAVALALTHAT